MRGLALVVMVAACGGGSTDIDATLVFADRSDTEIARIVAAAGGADMFGAQSQVDRFANEADPCPAVAIDGQTVTLTGGCTTMDGVAIEGTAQVVNPTAWDEIEIAFGDDQQYTLTGWTLTQGGFAQAYDGSMTIENFQTWDADVTVTQQDVTLRSDLHYECDTSECELDGSGLELIGVGGAQLSGTVNLSTRAASYALQGKDRLTVTVTQGCVAWKIDGSDRQKVCAP